MAPKIIENGNRQKKMELGEDVIKKEEREKVIIRREAMGHVETRIRKRRRRRRRRGRRGGIRKGKVREAKSRMRGSEGRKIRWILGRVWIT